MRIDVASRLDTVKKPKGFTLIEILVVIVVMGVLSTIAVVAYNGVQLRAENTQMLIAMDEWKKALKLYRAENGDLPATTSMVCIGSSYPATNGFPANSCNVQSDGTSLYNVDPAVNAAIAPYIDTMPATSNVTVKASGKFNFIARGVQYTYPPGAVEASLNYFIRGDQSCGSNDKFFYPAYAPGGVTLCMTKIPVENP